MEESGFEKRLATFLPLLSNCLALHQETQQIEEMEKEEGEEKEGEEEEGEEEDGGEEDKAEGEGEGEGRKGGEKEEKETEKMETQDAAGDAGSSPIASREAAMDHLLFSTLSTLEKVCGGCDALRVPAHRQEMNQIWGTWTTLYEIAFS